MISFLSILAASQECKIYVNLPKPSYRIITLRMDDSEPVFNIYSKVADILKVPVTTLKLTRGNTIPHRCISIKENGITDKTVLKLTYIKAANEANGNFTYRKFQGGMMMKKPVIYVYPTEEMDVTVSVKPKGKFTAVYPAFTDKKKREWKAHAYPCGKLSVDGRTYTSLFWEAKHKKFVPSFETGFMVTKENAISFLEEKLKLIGLTDLEANEFITFWVPVLNKNEKSIVSFQFENYEKAAPLFVTPKPDTVIRVFLGIKKATGDEQVVEQKLPTYERQGFTVVEWGGMDI